MKPTDIDANPALIAKPIQLASGEPALLRPLQRGDARTLGEYFLGLSAATRRFYAPHAFDQETADRICAELDSGQALRLLAKAGIPTHYLATLSDREMLCRKLDIIKVEVIPRNMVAGTLAKRTGLEEGVAIKPPIVELFYKSDPLGDPMITDDHVRMLKLASPKELGWLRRTALKVNAVLRPLLKRKGLILVDFKLEFGRHGGRLYLGDEIRPDT